MYKQRRRICKRLPKLYEKFYDRQSLHHYYHSLITKRKCWKRPLIFGRTFDLNTSAPVAEPHLEYVVKCDRCPNTLATAVLYDEKGNKKYVLCRSCLAYKRKAASSQLESLHEESLVICAECSYQVAFAVCSRCEDGFCDSCLIETHRIGNNVAHARVPLLVPCDRCSEVSARYVMGTHTVSSHSFSCIGYVVLIAHLGLAKLCVPSATQQRMEMKNRKRIII